MRACTSYGASIKQSAGEPAGFALPSSNNTVLVFSNTFHKYVLVMQFARLYPLNQLDLPVEKKHVDFGPLLGSGVKVENPSRDYTPPSEYDPLQFDVLRAVMSRRVDVLRCCYVQRQ